MSQKDEWDEHSTMLTAHAMERHEIVGVVISAERTLQTYFLAGAQ
jgi:hypothetical protein